LSESLPDYTIFGGYKLGGFFPIKKNKKKPFQWQSKMYVCSSIHIGTDYGCGTVDILDNEPLDDAVKVN
jgi:hypothetical protein